MTRNNLEYLPSEEALKESFPDIIAVDVEANPNFDCSTLDQYKQIQILSNCGKDESELDNIIVDTVHTPTDDCDMQCQLDYHYRKLHEYVNKILKVLKEKFEEAQKHPVVKDVKNWFSEMFEKIKKMEFRSPIVIKDE
uniref:Uncharacterized protein n=1 Tax=Acrobeloides nanus TaxID=290746 RepID=A0A914CSG3_9BILA